MSDLATELLHETPERVALRHDVAGIGTRFTAGLIDFAFLSPLLCVGSCGAFAVVELAKDRLKPGDLAALGYAMAAIQTTILWGYYLLLEPLWSGKTLGKHFMGIRVVSASGGAAPVASLILRNLVRAVDMIPAGHLFGGIVMFANGRGRRLGDLAAGTIVVRERRAGAAPAAVAATGDGLSAPEAALVRGFLARNAELDPRVRTDLAQRVVARIAERHALPGGDPEHLIALLGSGHTPASLRAMAGPARAPAPGGGAP